MDSAPPSPFGIEDFSEAESSLGHPHSDNEVDNEHDHDLFHPNEFFHPDEFLNHEINPEPEPKPMEIENEPENNPNEEPQQLLNSPPSPVASSSSTPAPLPAEITFPISEDVMRQLCENVRYLAISKDEVCDACEKLRVGFNELVNDVGVVDENLKEDKEYNNGIASDIAKLDARDQERDKTIERVENMVRSVVMDNREVRSFAEKGKKFQVVFEKIKDPSELIHKVVTLEEKVSYLEQANEALLSKCEDVNDENEAWSKLFRKMDRALKKKYGDTVFDDLSDDDVDEFAEDPAPSTRPSV